MYLKLKSILKDKNISGKELAEAVGVSENTISFISTGKTQPRFELLEEIANYLDIEIKDLFVSKKGNGENEALEPIYKNVGGQFVEIGYLTK